ncbi:cation-translocating P-type ATPase [Fluviicola taffensis]|uniref:ATPase, P-type (Transporting), HAD superfamily, subfamily IC n=1 Tax=Fluviicola taffensis (strain DSM 16823 / NCIMB 13979 / RW262) TaxID=755732 RepID=F2I9I6_FLUTR|nr:cation-translocating P-type ATPase [Fluviicola taffensis]AEA45167.1 ATPase, P-type (transporting), HAD superfamily, subfamily IC [Fluviicola taffensis DSM 16823]
MHKESDNMKGLTTEQVVQAREQFGSNELTTKKRTNLWTTVLRIAKEPMIILLFVAASIYFISGKIGDGIFLSAAILFQAFISIYQYSRSKNALDKLKDFSQPTCSVIRNGERQKIKSEEVVCGDSLIVEEGGLIIADGKIVQSNDFSVNESILTGESLPVFKDKSSNDNSIYSGTTVASGLAIIIVTAIGNETRLGKIGKSLDSIEEEKTPLELQIANFVKKMAIVGGVVFLVVWIINYVQSHNLLSSLLQSLTLAMSILPEEIPVAFTTFMALGAWRLMKMGVVVKQMKTVETLGSATVICTDKTGTITENKMSLSKLFVWSTKKHSELNEVSTSEEKELIEIGMWASEPIPFDPMEIALHQAYKKFTPKDQRPDFKLVHEYPLAGKPPMMTHVFEDSNGNQIIAAKGAVETMMRVSSLTSTEQKEVNEVVHAIAKEGYRVLGVGISTFLGTVFPENQEDLKFTFKGVVAFYDPPKKNIDQVLKSFYDAGIKVKIITGDNAETTTAIAKQIYFSGFEKSINGDQLMQLSDEELKECVMETAIFTRMFPDAKLKIINALKEKRQIVAMTGDGVNDGPALKAAHIGIAMGKKGTEIAKDAASLILLEDDLSKMIDAIAMGRKIYTNLKKAIQYIISIHIPIILTVFIPLALGWIYPNIFSPVHVIFLEIIMGPTCSIIYENEPMEKNLMFQKPKPVSNTFFNWTELTISIIQGLVIALGILLIYQYAVYNGFNEELTRTMVFTDLVVANIFLTLINRSFYYSIWTTLKYKNKLVVYIIGITLLLMGLLLFIPPLTNFFAFERMNGSQLLLCLGTGFISVIWFELVKWRKRRKQNPHLIQ